MQPDVGPTFRQKLAAWLGHRYPFLSGCGSFANSALIQGLAGRGGGSAWGRLSDGQEIRVSLDDFNGRAIYYVGDMDRKITRLCRAIVRPGDTVVDVGANLGLISMTLSRLVGTEGRVLAFEPNPVMQECLRESIARNRIANVSVFLHALGAEDGQATLHIPNWHTGAATLLEGKSGDAVDTVSVSVRRLGDVLREAACDQIRLVKIDVEGFEPMVLRGAQSWFKEHPPEAMIVEVLPGSSDSGKSEVIDVLEALDYDIYSIQRDMMRLRPRRLDSTTHLEGAHDVLAIHRGDSGSELRKRAHVRN